MLIKKIFKIFFKVKGIGKPFDKYEYLRRVSFSIFKKKYMDPFYHSETKESELNPFFLEYGFKFSRVESEYFGYCSGVKSDLYIPAGFWSKLLYPFLNKEMWREAYCDKNMFHRFLMIKECPDDIEILEPHTIVCCCSGRWMKDIDQPTTREEAIKEVINFDEDIIIKPTVHSAHGARVIKIFRRELSPENLSRIFEEYYPDFTVQEVIRQHPDLAAFNETSVNTIRITTYQDFDGEVKVLYASQRFGGKGKVYDNADDPKGDGGFCAIDVNGKVDRTVHHYRNTQTYQLSSKIPGIIPEWGKVVKAVLYLHRRFPQFALIGWDMTVTEEGHPLVIEYNFAPGLGTGQLAHGPIFSEKDLREIMVRIKDFDIKKIGITQISFTERPSYKYILLK